MIDSKTRKENINKIEILLPKVKEDPHLQSKNIFFNFNATLGYGVLQITSAIHGRRVACSYLVFAPQAA